MFKFFYTFFFSVLISNFFSFQVFANVCLHPLEEAALLSGLSQEESLSAQIKRTKRVLKKLGGDDGDEGEIGDLIEEIKGFEDDLKNSLKEDPLWGNTASDKKDKIVEALSDYIINQQDEWDKTVNGADFPWCESASSCNDTDKYFGRNGSIKEEAFCKDYTEGSEIRKCKNYIKKIEKRYEALTAMQELYEEQLDILSALEDRDFDRKFGLSDEEDTEADGLCFECLDKLRELDEPTTGQTVGNILSVVAGGALSYYGYKAGKRAGRRTDDLRARQGYEPLGSGGLSFAGATLGLPFISNGIYGLTGGNSRFGGFACGSGYANGSAGLYSPFGHYGTGARGNLGAYGNLGAHGNLGAYGGGLGFPGGGFNAGLQIGGLGGLGGHPGAYGGFPGGGFNAGAGLQIGGLGGLGGHPGAYGGFPGGGFNAGLQIGGLGGLGGFPGAYGGFPGGGFNAGAGLQIGGLGGLGGFPGAYGGFPGGGFNAGAGLQIGGLGGLGGFPGAYGGLGGRFPGAYGGLGGRFPGAGYVPRVNLQAQYQQQQQSQYLQFQQSQMKAQIAAQEAWAQHQQSIQKDWMQRQKVIGSLTQELYDIQQQIQLVSSGGLGSGILGASGTSIRNGLNLGKTPTHSPSPGNSRSDTSGELSVIESR